MLRPTAIAFALLFAAEACNFNPQPDPPGASGNETVYGAGGGAPTGCLADSCDGAGGASSTSSTSTKSEGGAGGGTSLHTGEGGAGGGEVPVGCGGSANDGGSDDDGGAQSDGGVEDGGVVDGGCK